ATDFPAQLLPPYEWKHPVAVTLSAEFGWKVRAVGVSGMEADCWNDRSGAGMGLRRLEGTQESVECALTAYIVAWGNGLVGLQLAAMAVAWLRMRLPYYNPETAAPRRRPGRSNPCLPAQPFFLCQSTFIR
ncbi:unnamed protein product, partial [Phaeothamnion confervicola]